MNDEHKIDINKTYRTRDGREVIIHTTEGPNKESPVIGSVLEPTYGGHYTWVVKSWQVNGQFCPLEGHSCDLIEVVPKWRGKVWVHKDGGFTAGNGLDPDAAIASGWRLIEVEEVQP